MKLFRDLMVFKHLHKRNTSNEARRTGHTTDWSSFALWFSKFQHDLLDGSIASLCQIDNEKWINEFRDETESHGRFKIKIFDLLWSPTLSPLVRKPLWHLFSYWLIKFQGNDRGLQSKYSQNQPKILCAWVGVRKLG